MRVCFVGYHFKIGIDKTTSMVLQCKQWVIYIYKQFQIMFIDNAPGIFLGLYFIYLFFLLPPPPATFLLYHGNDKPPGIKKKLFNPSCDAPQFSFQVWAL